MLKLEIVVNEPNVYELAAKLGLPEEKNTDIRSISEHFNENNSTYIKKAEDWGNANNTELSLSGLTFHPLADRENSFVIKALIEHINIAAAARALHIPSPIAAIASHMSEKSISGSLNTALRMNKKAVSNEAVRQFKNRGVEIGSASVEITAQKG